MLPKEQRLSKKRDIELVVKRGRWFKGRLLSLKILKLSDLPVILIKKEDPDKFKKQLKIAVSAGIKFSKKATDRNRIRRQVFEAVRVLGKTKKFNEGFFLLLTPNGTFTDNTSKKIEIKISGPKNTNNYLNHSFAEISEEIKLLFIKAGIINE